MQGTKEPVEEFHRCKPSTSTSVHPETLRWWTLTNTQVNNKLDWSVNTDALNKKRRRGLNLLRRPFYSIINHLLWSGLLTRGGLAGWSRRPGLPPLPPPNPVEVKQSYRRSFCCQTLQSTRLPLYRTFKNWQFIHSRAISIFQMCTQTFSLSTVIFSLWLFTNVLCIVVFLTDVSVVALSPLLENYLAVGLTKNSIISNIF